VIEVDVTNTGTRRGAEVVQCYRSQSSPRLVRPPKELVGFEKVWLDAGASATVTIRLGREAFEYFDPGDPGYEALRDGGPVPVGGGGASHRAASGWYVDPGEYQLHLATSAAAGATVSTVDIRLV
jgi:hypothetical protein